MAYNSVGGGGGGGMGEFYWVGGDVMLTKLWKNRFHNEQPRNVHFFISRNKSLTCVITYLRLKIHSCLC